ncbi:Protein spt10 [Friedmanniomyces endolithicus]|nr:Protein spt10 [Friedmanniomyces endolithicus]
MPAMLDDPTAPAIYRVSGTPPYPLPYSPLPPDIGLRQVTLRDRVTIATLVPFSTASQVPPKLTAYLCALLNREIEKGDTYPMLTPLPLSSFGPYWFANFGAVMLLGDLQTVEEVSQMEARGVDWARECLGSFYVKPNYPGRSSHVCNGGFLVTDAARNRGTNVASLRIWDGLGFKRIGRVKGCGNLKSFPDQYVDAIIFGRDLGGEGDEYVSEERFDKIRFYLKTGTYPNGSDRAEKSRLRSAATHYRLVPNPTGSGDGEEDKLMLKGKEVVADPNKQYEIACATHATNHGGINKTTAGIAEKYHWVRIKETVSAAIRGCAQCKDLAPKPSQAYLDRQQRKGKDLVEPSLARSHGDVVVAREDDSPVLDPQPDLTEEGMAPEHRQTEAGAEDAMVDIHHQEEANSLPLSHEDQHRPAPTANMHYNPLSTVAGTDYEDMPVDPQIMQSIHDWTQQHPEPEPYISGSHTLYGPQPDAVTSHIEINGGDESDTMALDTQPHEGTLAHELMITNPEHDDEGMESNLQADPEAQLLPGTAGGEGQSQRREELHGQQSQQLGGRNG